MWRAQQGQDPGEQSVAIAARLAGEEKAELIAERIASALGLGVRAEEERARRPSGRSGSSSRLSLAPARWWSCSTTSTGQSRRSSTWSNTSRSIRATCPILLICIARPELLDTRRGWGGGKLNATSILLEPLSEAESRQLISNLLDRAPLRSDVESRIAEAVEGNALFAEEMVAMLIDDQLLTREDDHWVASSDLSDLPVPSSIQALLAARVEGLPADQWAIVTAASVEGTVFHRGAVSELTPESFESTLELNLMDLVRRDVIRPDFADFPGDEAYRFRHALIRDAAYRSLSKGTSADLHERFAGWLERAAGEQAARVRGDRRLPPRAGVSMPAPRSGRSTHTRPRSRPGRLSGSSPRVDGRSRAATFPRRSASSSERRICSLSTHRDEQRCSRSSGRR